MFAKAARLGSEKARGTLKGICEYFGYSRQAYYKRYDRDEKRLIEEKRIIVAVDNVRKKLPRVGTRKLIGMIDVAVGRDRLFCVLRKHHKLVPQRRRYHVTTNSRHEWGRHRNLIRDKLPTRPNEQYVSDITYIRTEEGHSYLSLVTDRYSRAIVGYDLSKSLAVEGSIRAYKQALKQRVNREIKTIHHSDRGIQYSCHDYINLSKQHGIETSMTEENHVYENAMAERVNGILKTEFGLNKRLKSFTVAKQMVEQSIALYNNYRPHMSLGYKTPTEVHEGR